MNGDRVILHSDLNGFYASVETMLDPSLKGKAVAVCGCAEDRHGIILAKSEKAKAAGVKTGMVNWQALKLCPELILLPPQYDQYLKYSKLTREIYQRYTDLVEPFGMDECWLDVTESRLLFGNGREIAEKIRKSVKEELGLTVSIGVSFTKVFAKLGSDMKKPDAITEISRKAYREKVWPLNVGEMIYCGRSTTAKLAKYGIITIGQLAQTDPKFLKQLLGVNGVALWRYANGADNSRVMHKSFVSSIKSIGHGVTCVTDLLNNDEVWRVILHLSQDVGHRLRLHELSARSVQISVRSCELHTQQFNIPLPYKTQIPSEIAQAAFRVFKERYSWDDKIRSLTVRATSLVPKDEPEQLSLFIDSMKRAGRERLWEAVEDLRSRFGKSSLTYAALLGDIKVPDDGRHKVKMPGLMYR